MSLDIKQMKQFPNLGRGLLSQDSYFSNQLWTLDKKKRIINIFKKQPIIPFEIEIQPSSICNAFCEFCWGRGGTPRKNLLFSRKNMDRVVNQVLEFKDNIFEIESVNFCGSTGDPLMNSQIYNAIPHLTEKKNVRLYTNGLKLAEKGFKKEQIKTLGKLNHLNISLDAGSSKMLHKLKPGSKNVDYDSILLKVSEIKSHSEDITIIISFVITEKNYKEIIKATEKAKFIANADKINFRIDLINWTSSKYKDVKTIDLLNQAKSFTDKNFEVVCQHSNDEIKIKDRDYFKLNTNSICFACQLRPCIASDGCLYPCGHNVPFSPINFGNILKADLDTIWAINYKFNLFTLLPMKECLVCSPSSLKINRNLTKLFVLEKIQDFKTHDIREETYQISSQ